MGNLVRLSVATISFCKCFYPWQKPAIRYLSFLYLHHILHENRASFCTPQLKLDQTPVLHLLNTICFYFTPVYTCLCTKDWLCRSPLQRAPVWTVDTCMINSLTMYACQILYIHGKLVYVHLGVHKNCKPRVIV